MNKILICAIAGPEIGTGHVRRMITLIHALNSCGEGAITLLTTPLGARIAQDTSSDAVTIVTYETDDPVELAVRYLNATDPRDRPHVVILDNYHWQAKYESRLRPLCGAIVVVDDLADRPHDADLLLDQNAHHTDSDYRDLVPADCALAVGARYCLIGESFRTICGADLHDAGARLDCDRVFLSLGGGDPGGQLLRLTTLLLAAVPDRISLATGSHIADSTALAALGQAHGDRLEVVLDSSKVAQQMNDCGWAVSAGGTMTWERAVLGLPSLCLVLADNQEKTSGWLERRGIHATFDLRGDWTDAQFCKVVTTYRADRDQRVRHSAQSHALIDGQGADRVAQQIIKLTLRS